VTRADPGPARALSGRLMAWGFIAYASYHLWTTAFGMPVAYFHRPLHVTFAVTLGFLLYSSRGRKRLEKPPLSDVALALLSVACFGTVTLLSEKTAERLAMVDPLSGWELFVGGAGIVLILEMARRTVGWLLAAVAAVFLLYPFVGPHMPHLLAHRGFNWVDVIDYQAFGLEGIYSSAVGVSSTYIAVFIVFGTFLELCGAGGVMMDLGRILTGRFRGGPAKISVLTSAFFGSISGSAAANVYATGTFSIPLMRRTGYSATYAGAVEAAASTGGQLMPPIMGAAAFLMADILGISYLKVCQAALIPSFLYFFSVLMMVDFQAAKLGLKGVPREDLPRLSAVLRRSYLLVPIVVLLAVMIAGYTPFWAAFLATLAAVGVSWFDGQHRMGPRRILRALELSGQRTVLIAMACAGAGLIIGVVTLTGIGLNISSVIITASGGSTILALLLIMAASILLGMGTPTTVAYIIVATLGVPALEQLGFPRLSSHFFVFYFGVISMVTPPVAVASYAAAEVAGADTMRISFTASRLCFVAFLIPFCFMYAPELLMVGDPWRIAVVLLTATLGIVALAGAFEGWYFRRLGALTRLALFTSAMFLIGPESLPDLFGLGLFLTLTVLCWARRERPVDLELATQGEV
jgi:TRAP transporter 4TM/12TM fusion protein